MQRSTTVELLAVPGIPMVARDDDLAALIGEGLTRGGIVPRAGDVFVLTQKIVSKAEGRMMPWLAVTSRRPAISSRVITPGLACGSSPVSRSTSAHIAVR